MKPNEHKYHQLNNKYVHSIDTKRKAPHPNISRVSLSDAQLRKVLQEIEDLIADKENVQGINLLRSLKENMEGVKDSNLIILTIVNLAILYYKVGFLEQANIEFALALSKLRELTHKPSSIRSKDPLRIKYQTMMGKIQLQICILYSQLGKHDMALEHARNSSKINYNLIHDLLTCLYAQLNRALLTSNYPKHESSQIQLQAASNILNSIAVLNHLISNTKDLKLAFLQRERVTALEEQVQVTRKYGLVSSKIDMELLYSSQQDCMWIYQSKILDEIQLHPYSLAYFYHCQAATNNELISKITFLAISLYCYSTETRFMENNKLSGSHDVLDSQHWLSRSLQIAYSFLPAQAPILNQILAVHDRFHGLDKQTIPQDEEVTGFFKFLRPLTKPTATYTSKTACSPVMIRIHPQKADQSTKSAGRTQRDLPRNTIELGIEKDDASWFVKNNRIRGYSQAHKRNEAGEPVVERFISSRNHNESPTQHTNNIRTNYLLRKSEKSREGKQQMSDLHGKALISEDLLNRPQTIDIQHDHQDSFRSSSERKKKTINSRRIQPHNKNSKRNTNTINYEGLLLRGQRLEELSTDLFEKIQDTTILQSARIGGNVYISNNINFYISKNVESHPSVKNYLKAHLNPKQNKELNRRQIFLSKRRANNFIDEQL